MSRLRLFPLTCAHYIIHFLKSIGIEEHLFCFVCLDFLETSLLSGLQYFHPSGISIRITVFSSVKKHL